LSSSNEILAGEWWPEDYAGPPLVSVEEEAAEEMGLSLGDRLRFLVAGQGVEATVRSFRKVNWDSFQPNFFLVLSPNALEEFPASYVASLKVEAEQEGALLTLARALGVRRRTVLSGVLTEFAALGFAAGLLASAGASLLAAVISRELFELDYTFNPMLWISGLAGGVLLVCVSGFIAARGAINAPPADVLRAV
jgi:putative ABC transport system permease protein